MEKLEMLNGFLRKSYGEHSLQLSRARNPLLNEFICCRRLPARGLDDITIQLLLHSIAAMDSNNNPNCAGVGEREGRVYSALVRARHYHLAHGIGRSGNLNDVQPKALGSSMLQLLTCYLARHALRLCGLKACKSVCVLPVSTGMALTLCFGALLRRRHEGHSENVEHENKKAPNEVVSSDRTSSKTKLKKKQNPSRHSNQRLSIIWSRIDQKSCYKAMVASGCDVQVVELKRVGDALTTDVAEIESRIDALGSSNVLCVVTTTSTFAPRLPDDVISVAKLCQSKNVAHVVNNAYGLQCSYCCDLLERGMRQGRVDLFVQSTDKNFLVPIGGTIVGSSNPQLVQEVGKFYPGRASMSPILDLFITLLSLGVSGWEKLLRCRKELFFWFLAEVKKTAGSLGLRVLETQKNRISIAICLDDLLSKERADSDQLKALGSMLFYRGCTGARVVAVADGKTTDGTATSTSGAVIATAGSRCVPYVEKVSGHVFGNYGAHSDLYDHSYLTVACAIGSKKEELQTFLQRLEKCVLARHSQNAARRVPAP